MSASSSLVLPRAVLCAGLPSSGSTWIYNVVSQLAALRGVDDATMNIFADDMVQLEDAALDDGRMIVIKSHSPSHGIRVMTRLAELPVILSVREPRDAVASLMERFSLDFPTACSWVVKSADQLRHLEGRPNTVFLRYEDGFTASPTSVQAIADRLGIVASPDDVARITAGLAPKAVKALIAQLAASGVFEDRPAAETWDPKTHWHPSHVGDGMVGKWRKVLTSAQAAEVAYATRDFRKVFGYEAAPDAWVPGMDIDFSEEGSGWQYLGPGFSYPEPWGVWSDGPLATIAIPLVAPLTSDLTLQFDCQLGPSLASAADASIQIVVNGVSGLTLDARPGLSGRTILAFQIPADRLKRSRQLTIDVTATGLMTAQELGEASRDPRRLGLGLSNLRLIQKA